MNKYSLLSFLSVCCFSLASAPECFAATAADDTTTPILELKGEVYDYDTMTSLSSILMDMEGPGFNFENDINNIIIASCLNDLYSTAPKFEKSDYLSGMAQSLMSMKLQEQVLADTTVTATQMQDWADKNAQTYERKEQVSGRHLFMQVSADSPTSDSKTVKDKITKVRKDILGGLKFEDAVLKYSESGTSSTGGNLGYLSYRQPLNQQGRPMNIVLDNALFTLKPGQLSEVLETSAGYHLLYCNDRLTTHVPTVDELVTSGILPSAAQNAAVGDRMKELANAAKKQHKIETVVFNKDEKVTTDSVLLKIDGKELTANDFGKIYGSRFLQYFESIIEDSAKLQDLTEQLSQMASGTYAAIDLGLDKKYEVILKLLALKEQANAMFEDFAKPTCTVSDADVREFYDREVADPNSPFKLRRPEYAGYVVTIDGDKEAALKALEELKGISDKNALEKRISELSVDERKTSAGIVPLHVANSLMDMPSKQFDRFASMIEVGSWIQEPQALEKGWLLTKVTEKTAGVPVDFNEVKDQIKNYLYGRNMDNIRQQIIENAKDRGLFQLFEHSKDLGLGTIKNK